MAVEAELTAYIEHQLRDQGDEVEVRPDDDLVMLGLDSIAFVRLLAFIDDRYGLRVPDVDVTIDRFGTVAAMTAYLRASGVADDGDDGGDR
jgi:acyl carrier protein